MIGRRRRRAEVFFWNKKTHAAYGSRFREFVEQIQMILSMVSETIESYLSPNSRKLYDLPMISENIEA